MREDRQQDLSSGGIFPRIHQIDIPSQEIFIFDEYSILHNKIHRAQKLGETSRR